MVSSGGAAAVAEDGYGSVVAKITLTMSEVARRSHSLDLDGRSPSRLPHLSLFLLLRSGLLSKPRTNLDEAAVVAGTILSVVYLSSCWC